MAYKPVEKIVPIAHRIRLVDLLLERRSQTEVARILKKEFTLPHSQARMRELYFPQRGLYAVPRVRSSEILEAVKARLQRIAHAQQTGGRIYRLTKHLHPIPEPGQPRPAPTPAPVARPAPQPSTPAPRKLSPLALVKQALKERVLSHSIKSGKIVIPLAGNIRPLQGLMAQHRVGNGMYEVAVRKYLQALRVPGHRVNVEWVERESSKVVKPKAKRKQTSFVKRPRFSGERELQDTGPPKPLGEAVLEIHVTLKKKR